jgi:hypothetical protein
MLNLTFGWIWITMGFLSGAMLGMGFHKEQFMGGYGSWERRLARLGHIAFFGTGFINVMLGLTLISLEPEYKLDQITSAIIESMFIVGAVGMPLCCFVAAFCKRFRHAFVVPVVVLIAAGVMLSVELLNHPGIEGVFMNGGTP